VFDVASNFGQMTRAEKEQRFWLITGILSLLVGLTLIASFLFFIEQPFSKRHPGDHYYLAYILVTALGMAVLGVMKYMRLDEKDKAWYHTVISIIEVNMWIAIISVIIVVSGLILTYFMMM
jgi:hypothetical protein